MRKTITSVLLAFYTIALSACASHGVPEDEKYDPTASEALNITRMAGLDGLKDVPYQDWNNRTPIGDMLDSSYAISNIFTPAPGLGMAGGLAFSALFLLSNSEPVHPATYNHIWLWMPEKTASTPEEAGILAQKIVYDAVLSVLDPDGRLEVKTRTFKPLFASNSEHQTLVEPGCPEFHDKHNDSYELDCSGDLKIEIAYYYKDALKRIAKAPPFLDMTGQIRGPIEVVIRSTGIFIDKTWSQEDRDFWQKVSLALPEWAYIYVGPSKAKELVPVVFNKGEPLWFVIPNKGSLSND